MAGVVTTIFASILAFLGGGLFATLFTTYDDDAPNQGVAAVNGLVFVAIAFYVQLDVIYLLGALVAGIAIVGGVTEVMRQ
jgi:Kef-type K+ transport system membrane component KefB